MIRLDAISLGLALNQQSSTVLTPSQQRVPEGEKIRKQDMREKEKRSLTNIIDLKVKEVKKKAKRAKKIEREIMLDEFSKPKDQKQQRHNKIMKLLNN